MADAIIGRDPDAVAFEKTYPGLTCRQIQIWPTGFDFSCEGPAEVLIQHGLITQAMVDSINPCGAAEFGPGARKPQRFAPLRTKLRRKPDGSFHLRQFLTSHDNGTDEQKAVTVMAFCGTLGIEVPKPDPGEERREAQTEAIRAASAELSGVGRERFMATIATTNKDVRLAALKLRERQIGRRQCPRRWAVCGPLVFVDWNSVRAAVVLARMPS